MGPKWELTRDDVWYLSERPGEDPILSITDEEQRVFTLWAAQDGVWVEVGEYTGNGERTGVELALMAGAEWRHRMNQGR